MVDISQSIFRSAAHSTLSTLCRDGFPLPRFLPSGYHPLGQDKDHVHHHHHIDEHHHDGDDVQMPHHHDWHHEGHKGCNYTFTSLGGLWDCETSLSLIEQLIKFFKKVCLELARQGVTQGLLRPGRTCRWQLPKKRGWHLSALLLSWYLGILLWYLGILLSWYLSICQHSCYLSASAQVNAEGWVDGPPLPLPLPCIHHWSCRCFQACQYLNKYFNSFQMRKHLWHLPANMIFVKKI